jgi:hypothetical protein
MIVYVPYDNYQGYYLDAYTNLEDATLALEKYVVDNFEDDEDDAGTYLEDECGIRQFKVVS